MSLRKHALIAVVLTFILICVGCGNNENESSNNKPTQKSEATDPNKTAVDAKKELGALWEDLKADGQEVYSKLRDKKLVIPMAIGCISDNLKKDGGGKFPLLAFTLLESSSLSGPQEVVLLVTPEELEEIKKYNVSGKFLWGHLTVMPVQKLVKDKLVLSLVSDSKVGLKADATLWEVTPEQWQKMMEPILKNVASSISAYYIDNMKYTSDISALSQYGYKSSCWSEISIEINGKDSFNVYAISPDGKHRLTYDSTVNYVGGFLPISEESNSK